MAFGFRPVYKKWVLVSTENFIFYRAFTKFSMHLCSVLVSFYVVPI